MTSKSKNKGNSWERDIANHLSSAYQEKFIRVPHSGAYIGGVNSVRKQQLDEQQVRSFKGDIVPPSTWMKFNCEAKNYGDFPFHQLLQGDCKQLDTWLDQLLIVADKNDLNLLLFKISRKGKYAAVEAKHAWNLDLPHYLYNSSKFGKWLVFDYDAFWKEHIELVKQLSCK